MDYRCMTPVALIFFNRPDTFEKVFEKVRIARPKTLFLIQDGPRSEKDIEPIMQCRAIAESIDWDCEVIKDYSDVNLGCGVRPQSGITNAFKQVERLIILEDDCIPEETFFKYCEEMLERYADDQRICYISGLNHFETWNCCEGDYFFAKTGAIAAWATWKRAWSTYYDYYVADIANEHLLSLVKKQISNKTVAQTRAAAWVRSNNSLKNGEKLSHWDVQWGFVKYSQNMLVIVPKYNQIHNIGVGASSTHAQSLKDSSKNGYVKYKNFVFIPTHKLEFPLNHPTHCICDVDYDNLVYKCSSGNPVRRTLAKIVKKILRRR